MRLKFTYRNHRNITEEREIEPIALDYVATPNLAHGYAPGWFLTGWDFSRGRDGGVVRSFALSNIQMSDFQYGTRQGTAAFRLKLIEAGLTGLLEADQALRALDARAAPKAFDGVLCDAQLDFFFPNNLQVRLRGIVKGHAWFPDGRQFTSSVVTGQPEPNVFLTENGSVYKVETWAENSRFRSLAEAFTDARAAPEHG